MSDFSNVWENQVINDILRTAPAAGSGARPSAVYVALATVTIVESDTGSTITEPVGNSYARVQVTQADASWSAPSNGTTSNSSTIQFATPTGTWGTVVDFCLVDASSGGNIIAFSALDTSRPIDTGADVNFPSGSLTFSVS